MKNVYVIFQFIILNKTIDKIKQNWSNLNILYSFVQKDNRPWVGLNHQPFG